MSEDPVAPRCFDRWFRWRGRDVSRLEAFGPILGVHCFWQGNRQRAPASPGLAAAAP